MSIDYNKRQHLHYHNARAMSQDTVALWMNAIDQRVTLNPDDLVLDLGRSGQVTLYPGNTAYLRGNRLSDGSARGH